MRGSFHEGSHFAVPSWGVHAKFHALRDVRHRGLVLELADHLDSDRLRHVKNIGVRTPFPFGRGGSGDA